jgi:hypothetical protein
VGAQEARLFPEEKGGPVALTPQEARTIIAALRWWQGRGAKLPKSLQGLFELTPPLTNEEIDHLIDRLGLEPGRGGPDDDGSDTD